MPTLQTMTFAIERDQDVKTSGWTRVNVKVGDTVAKIAGARGHPEEAGDIMRKNRTLKGKRTIRSTRTILRYGPRSGSVHDRQVMTNDRTTLLVPKQLALPRHSAPVTVLAGDEPPKPTDGYAKFSVVDRPERVGLTRFDGYNPFLLTVPIQFENFVGGEGVDIESAIERLERMAGRGDLKGLNEGPPPIIRISSTDSQGKIVPLVSDQFQWTPESNAPLWRISDIEWDDGALRNMAGNRIRQKATVTLQQHTRIKLQQRSASKRAKSKKKKK
jgi:alkylated DNA nucleotide flippase Atl1